jgi:uncharacterized protein YjbI with pentapeptide repeats
VKLVENTTFQKENFRETPLEKDDYESCTFKNCDFSETDLSKINFSDCDFLDCNLSMAKLPQTAFRNVNFKGCKMLGLRFDHCYGFGLSFCFENCNLSHASFVGVAIKKTLFRNSQLYETDFTETNLTNSLFDNCDLTRAIFNNTVMEKTDFRTSYNYSIDPEMNRIKKALFSLPGVLGLLNKYDIQIEN